ncbi:MAG: pilus assembly protein [Xanthobacteraceae bacterium]|nr:pilus assembly protein [Xanthobacteraceae bacterium]
MLSRSVSWLRRLARDRRGNVAVIFAFASIPILAFVGAAIDYSIAVRTQTKIEAALDTALLLATSKGELPPTKTAAQAQADAITMFTAQLATFGVGTQTSTITVTDSTTGRTATGSATSVVPTTFMKILGFNSLTVNGSSQAVVNLPLYIDFYLLLDNTPSMGVGATTSDISRLQSLTTNGSEGSCAFACHNIYTDSSQRTVDSNTYYNIAKNNGVTMRIDVLRTATQGLMTYAQNTENANNLSNQFRMAIYTFGASCTTSPQQPSQIQSLTSNLTTAAASASAIDLMTIPYQNYNSDQCTDFDNILTGTNGMNSVIPTPGPGTSSSPQKWLFLVTDGVADAYYPTHVANNTPTGDCSQSSPGGGRCQEPLTVADCTTIKNRGVNIAVIYTTYLQLPSNGWYMSWIDPFNPGPWGPSPNSKIAQNLQSCANSGFYFEVSADGDISTAMNKLFQKVVSNAHLAM